MRRVFSAIRGGPLVGIALAGGVALLLLGPLAGMNVASAAAPTFLLRIPEVNADRGPGAGQLGEPTDVASDPDTGHLFVSDRDNARISEYTAWGKFVKAWGWDVVPDGAPGDTPADQLEVCTAVCKEGIEGTAAGQLRGPRGVVVDAAGDIYVYEQFLNVIEGKTGKRVQKFGFNGDFLLMFGGEVNKTTGANLCTKADVGANQECGVGVPGAGDGFFSNPEFSNFFAYGPGTNTLFVGDVDRIQEFDIGGNFIRSIDLEGELDGKAVSALDVDGARNFYVGVSDGSVRKLHADGLLLPSPQFETSARLALAVDVAGNVYSANSEGIRKFLSTGSPDGFLASEGVLFGVSTGFCEGSEIAGNVFAPHVTGSLAFINVYGTPPVGCEPPPPVPPEIEAQYAISVGTEEAVVRAQINPFFFTDTTYRIEYGTVPCSLGGCQELPDATLTSKVTNSAVRTTGVLLSELVPDTTYHFRFVADSDGGGPVFGIDPDGDGPKEASALEGLEGTFTTFSPPDPPSPCPNDPFRPGPGALLPDCRAYEMVSPLDKNNGDIVTGVTLSGSPTALHQSAVSGERFTYSSARAFANPQAAPNASQYLATRHRLGDPDEGWGSEAIAPLRTRVTVQTEFFQKNTFKAFSPDLCTAWLRSDADPPLASGAIPEFANLYRRENCGPLAYEALSTAAPADRKPTHEDLNQEFWVEFQGASADGLHAVFAANDNLIGTGAPDIAEGAAQLYEHVNGAGSRFVCFLPGGGALAGACWAGSGAEGPNGIVSDLFSNVHNAISADGSRIFWTAGTNPSGVSGPGRIFVRLDGAATLKVSDSVPDSAPGDPAQFWGAADDGSKAIFSFTAGAKQESLYEFDVDTQTPQLIAEGVKGVMGMSEDASRIYFASTKALDGAAIAGQPNLYLHEGGGFGTKTFIATLSGEDVSFSGLSPIASGPALRTSRVTPDGSHAVFASKGRLTGYDNTDSESGMPDSEVFLYDAGTGKLACLSCNPTNARPSGKDGVAATITPWERSLYASRAISDDGRRVFFESFEALELRDTNGVGDVYQWEAEGSGDCESGDHKYNPASGGCVDLISSGESARASNFLDASPDGADVFITTLSSLVPQDYGLVDVYDARARGGFPPPIPPKPPCEGEACQSPPAPPAAPTLPSTVEKPGNPKPRPCPKGKRKLKRGGKTFCKKVKRQGKRLSHHGRTAR